MSDTIRRLRAAADYVRCWDCYSFSPERYVDLADAERIVQESAPLAETDAWLCSRCGEAFTSTAREHMKICRKRDPERWDRDAWPFWAVLLRNGAVVVQESAPAVTDERERRYAAMVADRNSWRRTAETITAERDASRAELSRLRAELAALKEAR